MEILEQLYSDVSLNTIEAYDSHIQFHLKELLTMMSKNKLEDLSMAQLRMRQCFVVCYRYYAPQYIEKQFSAINQNVLQKITKNEKDNSVIQQLEQVRSCKQKCAGQIKKTQKLLEDINFYAKRKLQNGNKNCEEEYKKKKGITQEKQKHLDIQYNICKWKVLNKIDRRFKKYWKEQKQNVQASFISNF